MTPCPDNSPARSLVWTGHPGEQNSPYSLGRSVGPLGAGRTRRRSRSTLVARDASLAGL